MKPIEILIGVFFIIGILLGCSDSESMEWFLWSKVVAAGFLGSTMFLMYVTKIKEG